MESLLMALKSDPDDWVRRTVAEALRRLGNPDIVTFLMEAAFRDGHPSIFRAISVIGGRAMEAGSREPPRPYDEFDW